MRGCAGIGTQGQTEKAVVAPDAAERADEEQSKQSGFQIAAVPGATDALTAAYGTFHFGGGAPL